MDKNERELLNSGWKREVLTLHLQEYDEAYVNKHRRLSYDLGDDFTGQQISVIRNCFNEINNRFPNIKITVSGTGFVKNDDNNGND